MLVDAPLMNLYQFVPIYHCIRFLCMHDLGGAPKAVVPMVSEEFNPAPSSCHLITVVCVLQLQINVYYFPVC